MFKKGLFLAGLLLLTPCVWAQEAFWAFDDEGKELIIPPECDEVFEADELYEIGMRLLDETGYARQGAAYCLLAAALDGHVEAQYQVAHMYHKGIGLPKSDLAAYRWATLSALNGSEDGDRLGAGIEQFLSIQDIEAATNSLGSMMDTIKEQWRNKILEAEEELSNRRAYRDELLEQKKAKKKGRRVKKTAKASTSSVSATPAGGVAAGESLFSQDDLKNVPMPKL